MLFSTQCFNNQSQGFVESNSRNDNSYGFNCQHSNCQYQEQFCAPKHDCFKRCNCPCNKPQKKEFMLVVEGKVSIIEKPRCPFC